MLTDAYQEKIDHLQKLINQLNYIGVMLSSEKNTDRLLELIVEQCMEITQCDAGSIYIKMQHEGEEQLMFKTTRTLSREFPFVHFFLPINQNSISGYCAFSGETLLFNRMEEVRERLGLKHNTDFDKKINYKTRNMLVVPMKDLDGDTRGVIQLINKKKNGDRLLMTDEDFDNEIIDFNEEEQGVILSLASQTAVLLERNRLMEEIETLFETFVECMVTTIEKRDPTTSGHSLRVAQYVKKFAETMNEIEIGNYKDIFFSEEQIKEIYYAALLHDVGKIGVSETILQKENRLSDSEVEVIQYRMAYCKAMLLLKRQETGFLAAEAAQLDQMDFYLAFIGNVNRKYSINESEVETLKEIADIAFIDFDKTEKKLLTQKEVQKLMIKSGNLTQEDRLVMNMHAEYTYQILKDILWSKELKHIPSIAAAHHEKIDGTGYPNRLKEEQISVQSRMLAIVDIYEALTAIDRPYKKPMPVEKALKIIQEEAVLHHLDIELVRIFCDEKVYEVIGSIG